MASANKECAECTLFKGSSYSLSVALPPGVLFEDAVEKVKTSFMEAGFGLPPGTTNLDIPTILQNKGLPFGPKNLTILGFCSPRHASQGLAIEPTLALLIPCNVSVATNDEGVVEVAVIDPYAILGISSKKDELRGFVEEIRTMLKNGIDGTLAACAP